METFTSNILTPDSLAANSTKSDGNCLDDIALDFLDKEFDLSNWDECSFLELGADLEQADLTLATEQYSGLDLVCINNGQSPVEANLETNGDFDLDQGGDDDDDCLGIVWESPSLKEQALLVDSESNQTNLVKDSGSIHPQSNQSYDNIAEIAEPYSNIIHEKMSSIELCISNIINRKAKHAATQKGPCCLRQKRKRHN